MSLQPLVDQLHLPHLAAALDGWLDRAAQDELSFAELLQGVCEEAAAGRAQADAQRRRSQAGFPFAASIEHFDVRFRPDRKRQVVLRYLDPSRVTQATTLAGIGPPGLGKTMLAFAIATQQVQLGATARCVTAQQFAARIGRAATVVGRQRILRPLLGEGVLVRDELGYLPTTPAFGPALYELIAGRYEQRPTISTANTRLTDWAQIVHDVSLAAAIVDRRLHHGQILYLKGASYRVKDRTPDGAADHLASG